MPLQALRRLPRSRIPGQPDVTKGTATR